jgi:hypothetical protein
MIALGSGGMPRIFGYMAGRFGYMAGGYLSVGEGWVYLRLCERFAFHRAHPAGGMALKTGSGTVAGTLCLCERFPFQGAYSSDRIALTVSSGYNLCCIVVIPVYIHGRWVAELDRRQYKHRISYEFCQNKDIQNMNAITVRPPIHMVLACV